MRLQEGGCYVHLFACQKKRTKATHSNAELLSISFEKKCTKETARGPAPATPDKRHIGGGESIDPPKAVRQPFPNSTAHAVSNMRKGLFCSAKSPHVPAESLYSYRRGLFILFTVQQLSGSPTSQKVAAKLHFLRKRRRAVPRTGRPCGGFLAAYPEKSEHRLCLPCVRGGGEA